MSYECDSVICRFIIGRPVQSARRQAENAANETEQEQTTGCSERQPAQSWERCVPTFGENARPESASWRCPVLYQPTVESQLRSPIKNIGVKGLRHTSKAILKRPNLFEERELRMNLFSLYIFIEIGGTGGGCFRYMYSRFLKEAEKITESKVIGDAAEMFYESGQNFTEIGLLFKYTETMDNLYEKLRWLPKNSSN